MKKNIHILAVLMAIPLFAMAAHAEDGVKSSDIFKQEITLTRAALEAQRKAVVVQGLQLSNKTAVGFWPVYNDFRAAMQKTMDKRVSVIADYADAYAGDALTDKGALKLMGRYLKSLEGQLKVKKSFVKKFKKVLSGKEVARFYQIDHRLDLLVNLQIAHGVPLVK